MQCKDVPAAAGTAIKHTRDESGSLMLRSCCSTSGGHCCIKVSMSGMGLLICTVLPGFPCSESDRQQVCPVLASCTLKSCISCAMHATRCIMVIMIAIICTSNQICWLSETFESYFFFSSSPMPMRRTAMYCMWIRIITAHVYRASMENAWRCVSEAQTAATPHSRRLCTTQVQRNGMAWCCANMTACRAPTPCFCYNKQNGDPGHRFTNTLVCRAWKGSLISVYY